MLPQHAGHKKGTVALLLVWLKRTRPAFCGAWRVAYTAWGTGLPVCQAIMGPGCAPYQTNKGWGKVRKFTPGSKTEMGSPCHLGSVSVDLLENLRFFSCCRQLGFRHKTAEVRRGWLEKGRGWWVAVSEHFLFLGMPKIRNERYRWMEPR